MAWSRLNLAEIDAALADLGAAPRALLDAAGSEEPMTADALRRLGDGYRYVDALLADRVEIFRYGASGAILEYYLLKARLQQRIGVIELPGKRLIQFWAMAIIAGSAARGALYVLPPAHPIIEAVLAAGVFGSVYLGSGIGLGLPEAKRFLRRGR